jgi:hypothetical protein
LENFPEKTTKYRPEIGKTRASTKGLENFPEQATKYPPGLGKK